MCVYRGYDVDFGELGYGVAPRPPLLWCLPTRPVALRDKAIPRRVACGREANMHVPFPVGLFIVDAPVSRVSSESSRIGRL